MTPANFDVRFTPNSGRSFWQSECLLWANSGHPAQFKLLTGSGRCRRSRVSNFAQIPRAWGYMDLAPVRCRNAVIPMAQRNRERHVGITFAIAVACLIELPSLLARVAERRGLVLSRRSVSCGSILSFSFRKHPLWRLSEFSSCAAAHMTILHGNK
jgi:hypothetical protein